MSQYGNRYDVPSWSEVEHAIKRLEVGPGEANGMRLYYARIRCHRWFTRSRIHIRKVRISFWDVVKFLLLFVAVTALVLLSMAL